MELQGKHILVGLTGGIAAYKVCELVRRLRDEGAAVQVAMSANAQHFVTPTTMQALSGRPVATDQWGAEGARVPDAMPHIALTRGVDLMLVAPASTNFIAKAANGIADDLLSTLAVARACPLLVAPAMNVEMWSHPATQRNLAQLKADGVRLLGPASGQQACGEVGAGRMLEASELLTEVIAFFQPQRLAGKRVLITAGPTFEPIDPVRGITNLSSGKQGFALARAAREAGAEVVLVAGPTALPTPAGVRRIDVITAREMLAAVLAEVASSDIFIGVAAVADWRVAKASQQKIKKRPGSPPPALEFELNPDILATVAASPVRPFCVGFAAESENVLDYARAKLVAKKLDLIVANRAQDALGADGNDITLIDADGATALGQATKLEQARRIVAAIAQRISP